ncbi:hypothetical protein [Rhizobium sp. Root708]|uniref:hypothetical protein n=1 Tax=Rhizobium sp. Root708 TaxID=1736592 RepID=UPI0012E3C3AC|nr:hypothetical protein [Rhizobium sp. Root708]
MQTMNVGNVNIVVAFGARPISGMSGLSQWWCRNALSPYASIGSLLLAYGKRRRHFGSFTSAAETVPSEPVHRLLPVIRALLDAVSGTLTGGKVLTHPLSTENKIELIGRPLVTGIQIMMSDPCIRYR